MYWVTACIECLFIPFGKSRSSYRCLLSRECEGLVNWKLQHQLGGGPTG